MKKVIMSIAILLASFTTSLFALEWGGLINNGTFLSSPDFHKVAINQSNEVYFWANSALNKSETLRFATEGMYRFTLDTTRIKMEDHGIKNAVDANVLKISGNWTLDNNNLLLDVGRFSVTDKAASYFNQKSDGISLRYNTRSIKLGLYAGYTGLQNKHTTMMQKDYEALDPSTLKQFYETCYPYVPLMADFTINKVGPLSLTFQGAYFLDIKNKENVLYTTIGLKGGMGNIGSYTANLVLGSKTFKDFMVFGNADLTFFINTNVLVMAGAEYASGKTDKIKMTSFSPISVRPVGTGMDLDSHVIAPRISGIFMIGDALISLNEKLTMSSLNERFIINCLDSSLGIMYNVFSDLQVGATATASIDFNQNANNNYGVMINASLSF